MQGDNLLNSSIPASWLGNGPFRSLTNLSVAYNNMGGFIPTASPNCTLCGFSVSAFCACQFPCSPMFQTVKLCIYENAFTSPIHRACSSASSILRALHNRKDAHDAFCESMPTKPFV